MTIMGKCGLLWWLFSAVATFAGNLPVITIHPQNQIAAPGPNALLSVSATNATIFQWRFNGSDIPSATTAALTLTNVQGSNAGYYMVMVGNSIGRVPSQLAYLSVVGTAGRVPFSNRSNSSPQANYQFLPDGSGGTGPITNGAAVVVAGPALDQMQPVSTAVPVQDGYFHRAAGCLVPAVAPGQTCYYRVEISYPNAYAPGGTYTQQSTVLKFTAGGGAFPTPTATNLNFPVWLEWPDPLPNPRNHWIPFTNRNRVAVAGEGFSITNGFTGWTDFGIPTYQWRKDGKEIGSPENFTGPPSVVNGLAVLTFTNFQASDAGVYDVVVLGNDWFIGPENYLSLQTTNGPGVLQNPRVSGTNFICDLIGAETRSYEIQYSTNLTTWIDLQLVTNSTGSVTFTNALPSTRQAFFRTRLLLY